MDVSNSLTALSPLLTKKFNLSTRSIASADFATTLLGDATADSTSDLTASPTASQAASPIASSNAAQTSTSSSDPVQTFLDYMKKSPAERLEDAWLQSHHLTKKDLEAMSPEKRQAIEKQMAEEIKDQLKKATEAKAGAQLNILA